MAHYAYLTITSEKQGLITSGCNTKDSMGGKYQESHCDEISVISTEHSMMKFQGNATHKAHNPLTISKFIDKSTPLLASAFARQELLQCTLDYYRTNEQGFNEKFYSIVLHNALIVGLNFVQPHAIASHEEEPTEIVSFSYKEIVWKHNISGTEGFDNWENGGRHEES